MCFYITLGNQTWQLTIPIKNESFPGKIWEDQLDMVLQGGFSIKTY